MAAFSSHQLFYFFFFLFFLALLPNATHASTPVHYLDCRQNFTKNNILQTNIDIVLFDMVARSSLYGYSISNSATKGCDTVYGVARCQADISAYECSACITAAAQKIRSACPVSAESRIWIDNCFLHYATRNFIGSPDYTYANVWFSAYPAENPKAFVQAVGDLMGEVVAKTAEGWRKFAHGVNHVDERLTVYGMAQCTRDLGEVACNQCLQNGLGVMSDLCGNQQGCRFFGSSCVMRYEIYKFSSIDSTDDDVVVDDAATAPAPSPVMLG